jgi:Predicted membrane protein
MRLIGRPADGNPRGPMSLRDWLAVFKSSGKEFLADDCMGLSHQVAYSSLLAFFPAMIALIAFLDLIGAYGALLDFLTRSRRSR